MNENKKENRIHLICAVIGITIGFFAGWKTAPKVIEEHQHWCDGVEVVRTINK